MPQLSDYAIYFLMASIGVPIMLVVIIANNYLESPLLLAIGFLVTWVGVGALIMKITRIEDMIREVLGI